MLFEFTSSAMALITERDPGYVSQDLKKRGLVHDYMSLVDNINKFVLYSIGLCC